MTPSAAVRHFRANTRKVMGRVLTQPCDRGTKVAQYGRTGVAHLTLNRQLRLHVDLPTPAADHGDPGARDGKDGREGNNGEALGQHGDGELYDSAEV